MVVLHMHVSAEIKCLCLKPTDHKLAHMNLCFPLSRQGQGREHSRSLVVRLRHNNPPPSLHKSY